MQTQFRKSHLYDYLACSCQVDVISQPFPPYPSTSILAQCLQQHSVSFREDVMSYLELFTSHLPCVCIYHHSLEINFSLIKIESKIYENKGNFLEVILGYVNFC